MGVKLQISARLRRRFAIIYKTKLIYPDSCTSVGDMSAYSSSDLSSCSSVSTASLRSSGGSKPKRRRAGAAKKPERSPKPQTANPASIIVWAFKSIDGATSGLSSRRLIAHVKKHYSLRSAAGEGASPGRTLGAALRYAVEFGLVKKEGKLYYLNKK